MHMNLACFFIASLSDNETPEFLEAGPFFTWSAAWEAACDLSTKHHVVVEASILTFYNENGPRT